LKKQIIFFILSVYVISGTALREITKLPVLFQHFYEHKVIDCKITFTEYLCDHYNSIPHSDNDEERDNQLPFKTSDLNVLKMPAIPEEESGYLQRPVRTIVADDTFLYKENFISAPDCGQVWQPPRA